MIKLYKLFPCRDYLEQWVKDEQFDQLNRFGLFANLRYHYTQHHEIAESEDLRRILNFSKMATSAFWNIWISMQLRLVSYSFILLVVRSKVNGLTLARTSPKFKNLVGKNMFWPYFISVK